MATKKVRKPKAPKAPNGKMSTEALNNYAKRVDAMTKDYIAKQRSAAKDAKMAVAKAKAHQAALTRAQKSRATFVKTK